MNLAPLSKRFNFEGIVSLLRKAVNRKVKIFGKFVILHAKAVEKLPGAMANEMVMTVHRWFANKACPGDYLYNLHDEIAAEVNRRLSGGTSTGGGVTTTHSTGNSATGGAGGAVTPYLVRVTISDLYIRKGPGTNYGKNGFIKPGVYTIVAESTGTGATKWGKLKSGAGWISLDYAKKA